MAQSKHSSHARHRGGYSLRELARVADADHNQLWMCEAGRRNPQPHTLRKLATVLGVEVKDLLKGG